MPSLLSRLFKDSPTELVGSKLYNHDTFYKAIIKDLNNCKSEVIIESPYMTSKRMMLFWPVFRTLKSRGVKISINTCYPSQHEESLRAQSEAIIDKLLDMDIQIINTGKHHRKLAIIDRKILYEGSLNILSQRDSSEIMRRIESEKLANEMIEFTKLDQFLKKSDSLTTDS